MFEDKNGKIQIFTDGGNLDSIIKLSKDSLIDGITTNPSLMRKSQVTNYMTFAKSAVKASRGKSLSLEVFADNHEDMKRQALKLHSLGESVYVKIPIINSNGLSSIDVIKFLLDKGIAINITALLSSKQIKECINLLEKIVLIKSIFLFLLVESQILVEIQFQLLKKFKKIEKKKLKNVKILWASTREVFNVYQAIKAGCDIITLNPQIIGKLKLKDYDLEKLSFWKLFKCLKKMLTYLNMKFKFSIFSSWSD